MPDETKLKTEAEKTASDVGFAAVAREFKQQADDEKAAIDTAEGATTAAPKQRGNTPLPVRGKERSRIPDEHDVIFEGEIIGRDPDPVKREEIAKAAQDGEP